MAAPAERRDSKVTDAKRDDLQSWLLGALDSPLECGGAVAVVEKDGLSCAFAGTANSDDGRTVRKDTAFPIACLSKPLLTTLVLILVDAGRLSLDERVCRFVSKRAGGRRRIPASLRVHHLLTHCSGLSGAIDFDERGLNLADDVDVDEFVEIATPGDIYSYSTFGFLLLLHVIEAVADADWRTALNDRLAKPLRIAFVPGQSGSNAACHTRDPSTGRMRRDIVTDSESRFLRAAALDLHMTAEDIGTFAGVHLNAGKAPCGRRLLSETSCRLMHFASYRPRFGHTPILGLGWKHFGGGFYGHLGSCRGCSASLLFGGKTRKALISLANSDSSTLRQRLHGEHAFPKIVSEYSLRTGGKNAAATSLAGCYAGADCFAIVEDTRHCGGRRLKIRFHQAGGEPLGGGMDLLQIGMSVYVGRPADPRLPKGILVEFVPKAPGFIGWALVNGAALKKR